MFDSDDGNLEPEEVWKQKAIPVILRRGKKGQQLRVRLPYSPDNKVWLQNARRTSPEWVEGLKCWEIPKTWFNDFVDRALNKYKRLYIVQPFREQEKCSPSCLNAEGHVCECSCMGANHGAGNDGSWFEVTEAFAFRSGDQELACRLMIADQSR